MFEWKWSVCAQKLQNFIHKLSFRDVSLQFTGRFVNTVYSNISATQKKFTLS